MRDTLGMCDPTKYVIYINPDQTNIQQYSTYLHETTHAILFAMGYDDEEQFVTSFEELLLQVLTSQQYSKSCKKTL
jgi:L-rhamnose mutarotase